MYKTYKELDLVKINEECKLTDIIKDSQIYDNVITCYDGPPSVSGLPGVHHVLSRTLKDIFCRYYYLKGNKIYNRSGWDTHGLPVELKVEKNLGITKKDIGAKISVEEFNKVCHKSVGEYISEWKDLTKIHGYCTDIDNPYVTCDKNYIESEWWAFKELFDKGYIYRDYSIQPYSPAAGVGLSSHELNQPGCYKNIKDLTVTVMFKMVTECNCSECENMCNIQDTYFLAWTTTPWTLPANSALAVNKNVTYVKVNCTNPYSKEPISVILAKDALNRYFKDSSEYEYLFDFEGSQILGLRYEPLFKFNTNPVTNAFKIISADFVTTTDGTGIVHISPSFGVDDRKAAKQNNIDEITVSRNDKKVPIVNEEGKYVDEIEFWKGCYVRKEYYNDTDSAVDVNVEIVKWLKENNRCFKSERVEHSYPHCWRTDKPLIYYPLASWFIKTTKIKDRLIELNNNIHWYPNSTGEGRFKNWLENVVDWNVSRNRFWGVPIPIWITEDYSSIKCIGSYEELDREIKIANDVLHLNQSIDFNNVHKPFIDNIVLVDSNGKIMHRSPEVLDVWFDSGCMPFAQFHYPFENKEIFNSNFPADFICEGVDQTRGWFYTLHILSVILFDKYAYKNVVSNGLVLDKNGDKMSKRLNNTIDPFELFKKYGSDSVRWYMIINSEPWENLKFNIEGLKVSSWNFFSTLFNVYNFFALYYNVNEDKIKDIKIDIEGAKLNVIDRWIISRLNSVIRDVDVELANFNPTRAVRIINDFVVNELSNWYLRINRKRFSRNKDINDCALAFEILYECLKKTSLLIFPFSPFFSTWLNKNLDID